MDITKLSQIIQLAIQKPSIFHHMKKMHLLHEIALRKGWNFTEDEQEFIDSFTPINDNDLYSGQYLDQTITVDANSGTFSVKNQKKKSA